MAVDLRLFLEFEHLAIPLQEFATALWAADMLLQDVGQGLLHVCSGPAIIAI